MTRREKILAALVAAIVVLLGLRSVHSRLGQTYRDYVNQEISLTDSLATEELKVAAGRDAVGRLSEWRGRSLPPDRTSANLEYQTWLRRHLSDSGMEFTIAEPDIATRPDGYLLTYKVETEGSLEDVLKFLYDFYEANHLHKISKLGIQPDESGRNLGIDMTVEAWALNDSFNKDGLAEGESGRLAHDSLDKYEELIVERNIFQVYEPPQQVRVAREERSEPPFDHAQHARATGIVSSNGQPKVFLYVQTTGDKYWLNEGETFKVGELECRVVKIEDQSFVFEAEGQQYTVKVGSSLREGVPVSGEQAT